LNFLIELHYLPAVSYFAALQATKKIVIEKHEYYVKQSYRNRCHILTSQGIERLTIPLTSKHHKPLITDIKIDYSQKWLNQHWRALQSAYRKSPFFDFYADDLHHILFQKTEYLYDLNLNFLTICLSWLKSDITIHESMSYEKNPQAGTIDLRNIIHAKKPELAASYYKPVPYPQVFGNKFVEGLSIIDLVFCEGPNARSVVAQSHNPK
jgi:hypothetical protein